LVHIPLILYKSETQIVTESTTTVLFGHHHIYSFDKRLTDHNPHIGTSHVIVSKNNSKIESEL